MPFFILFWIIFNFEGHFYSSHWAWFELDPEVGFWSRTDQSVLKLEIMHFIGRKWLYNGSISPAYWQIWAYYHLSKYLSNSPELPVTLHCTVRFSTKSTFGALMVHKLWYLSLRQLSSEYLRRQRLNSGHLSIYYIKTVIWVLVEGSYITSPYCISF